MFEADEGPRKDSSMESLAKLRPLMKDGSVTAGNSSSQNDAASVCLVVAAEKLDQLGLEPMAYLKGWASAGVHPAYMGVGPVPAVNKLFAKTGYGWKDVDLIELNEAFASQVLSVIHQWQAPRGRHPRHPERQRVGHIPRSPNCCHRGPYPRHHALRDETSGCQAGPGDHVRRRWPGRRGPV